MTPKNGLWVVFPLSLFPRLCLNPPTFIIDIIIFIIIIYHRHHLSSFSSFSSSTSPTLMRNQPHNLVGQVINLPLTE